MYVLDYSQQKAKNSFSFSSNDDANIGQELTSQPYPYLHDIVPATEIESPALAPNMTLMPGGVCTNFFETD